MPTLTQLSSNLTEIVIYAAIALVTLTGLCKCIYPLLRNAALLNRAVIKLEKSTAAGERPIWREARFLGRSLRNEWQQFLLNAGQLDMRGIPCDTREYINEETVVDKPGHAQLAELIPGLLTSLGILGTFVGLMQGLTSVDFSNAEGTIQSIPQLLSGMRFAFATSVAVILPLSLVSAAVYWLKGGVDLAAAWPYLLGGAVGGLLSGKLFQKVPLAWLRRAFGALILYGGVRAVLAL